VQESRYSIPYYPAVIPAPVARGSGYSSSVSSALHSVLHIPCLLVNSANLACVTRSRERTGFRPCTLRNRAQSVSSRAHKSSRSPLLARPRLSPVYGHSLKVYVHQKVDGVRLRASSDAASCARIAASAELASERGRERERAVAFVFPCESPRALSSSAPRPASARAYTCTNPIILMAAKVLCRFECRTKCSPGLPVVTRRLFGLIGHRCSPPVSTPPSPPYPRLRPFVIMKSR